LSAPWVSISFKKLSTDSSAFKREFNPEKIMLKRVNIILKLKIPLFWN
jgi:hypothetical protein